MCNRYGYSAPISRLVDEFSHVRIPLRLEEGAISNVEPCERIQPTHTAPIVRPLDGADPHAGVELVEARWWLVPFFHHGPVEAWKPMCAIAPVETVATSAIFREPFQRRRCLVPATHFFEWTGPEDNKTLRRFSKVRSEIFCFPGLWDRANTADGVIRSFSILTCAPGLDCEPYHDRQPVILEREQWALWLDLSADPTPILRAGKANTLAIEWAVETPTLSSV